MARVDWSYETVMTGFQDAIGTYNGDRTVSRQDYADKRDARKQPSESKRRQVTQTSGTADWAGADAGLVLEAIAVVAWQGGALRFGYTRDGGAYCIGILGDGDPYNEYCKPSEDINQHLRSLVVRWRD